MNNVFSFQSLSPQENDVIIIDGIKSEFTGNAQQIQAAKLLHPQNGMLDCSMIKWVHRNTSCNIYMYLGKKRELLVISNFETKDSKGRAVSYSFYCKDAIDYYHVISILNSYCQMSGVLLCETDKKCIKEVLFLKNHRIYIYGAFAIILLGILKAIF